MAAIEPGSELGPYRILMKIGSGGIGEVWKAVDSRLGRHVALKILLTGSFDPASRVRFSQEARATSALVHPNLVTVFEAGEHDGHAFIAMEFLEGSSLGEVLRDGPLPFRVALRIAVQVARGLCRIHEAGIVHRDLKPENVMIAPDGAVKIVDFGLAKIFGSSIALAPDPRLTRTGFIAGTAAYVSPEQARAESVGPASDQFSFGIILFEMLSGRSPFSGEAAVQIMTSIIEDAPASLGDSVPGLDPRAVQIVERCLAKEAEKRFASTLELLAELEEIQKEGTTALAMPRSSRPHRHRRRLIWVEVVAGVLLLLVGLLFGALLRPSSVSTPPAVLPLTYSGLDSSPASSPDGRLLAFTSERDGTSRIWVKVLPGGGEAPLTSGSDDNPRFSPDGNQVIFLRQEGRSSSLFRIPVLGGEPRRLLANVTGADWAPDGLQIAFTRWTSSGTSAQSLLGLISADGGGEKPIAQRALALMQPRFSPDGRYIVMTSSAQAGVQGGHLVYDLAAGRFLPGEATQYAGFVSSAAFTKKNELVYLRAETRTPFVLNVNKPSRLLLQTLEGKDPVTLLWTQNFGLTVDLLLGNRVVLDSRSARGNLLELPLGRSGERPRPQWLTRGYGKDRQPIYSGDSKIVAFSSLRTGNWDVWTYSRSDGSLRNVTDHPADDWDPAFFGLPPRLLFSSNRSGNFEIWMSNADGTLPGRLTSDGVDAQNPTASPDGKWIVYTSSHPAREGLWKLQLSDQKETHLHKGRALLPEVSPDGEFVLFMTGIGETGAVVRVVHSTGGVLLPYEITVGSDNIRSPGAGRARWMPDGRHIAFLGPVEDGTLGVHLADFDPMGKRPAAIRLLTRSDPGVQIETFGISPDSQYLTIERVETLSTVAVTDRIRGVEKARMEKTPPR